MPDGFIYQTGSAITQWVNNTLVGYFTIIIMISISIDQFVFYSSQEGHHIMKNGQMKYVQRKETSQYFPILETLTALLNHPDILTEVCVALSIY